MTNIEKISAYQLFFMMAVSRTLSTLTFIPKINENASLFDYAFASFIAWAVMPLIFLPVFMYIKKSRSQSIFEHFPKMQKPLAAAFIFLLLFIAVFTLSRLNLFVSTVFFPDKDSMLLIIITVLAVLYCAYLSIEPILRAGSLIFVALFMSLGVIMISLVDKVDFNYITPVFSGGIIPFFKLALSIIIRTAEPIFLMLLLPNTKGNITKGFLIWTVLTGIFLSALTLLLTVTLGETALYQLFPYHAMAQLASFGVIERMDALLTGVWILSAFLRLCVVMYLVKDIVVKYFKFKKEKTCLAVSGTAIALAVILSDKSVLNFQYIFSMPLRIAIFIAFVILLPSAALIKIKRKGRAEK